MSGFGPDLSGAESIADDDEGELSDERCALHVGDELRGGKERVIGEEPADERFGRPRLAGLQVDDRLIDDDQLVVGEGHLDVADDAGVHTAA